MSVGSSLSWREVIKIATAGRTSNLDSRPLLEYFKPLHKWLETQNQNEPIIGWSNSKIETGKISVLPLPPCFVLLEHVSWRYRLWEKYANRSGLLVPCMM